MKYNYFFAVEEDIKEYILSCYTKEGIIKIYNDEDMRDDLYDELFTADIITGNASGSYTFSAYSAECNICHNLDLLEEALESFGFDESFNPLKQGAEWCDVTIRCYVFSEIFADTLDNIMQVIDLL